MKKFRFLEWQVYKDSKILFTKLTTIVHKLPKEYRYEIGSQIVRAGLSIILNIAEGSGKTSDRELNRYLDISMGSLYETFSAIDVLQDNGLITEAEFAEIQKMTYSISNQLGGFKKSIN